jgi:hypothetical protein
MATWAYIRRLAIVFTTTKVFWVSCLFASGYLRNDILKRVASLAVDDERQRPLLLYGLMM